MNQNLHGFIEGHHDLLHGSCLFCLGFGGSCEAFIGLDTNKGKGGGETAFGRWDEKI